MMSFCLINFITVVIVVVIGRPQHKTVFWGYEQQHSGKNTAVYDSFYAPGTSV